MWNIASLSEMSLFNESSSSGPTDLEENQEQKDSSSQNGNSSSSTSLKCHVCELAASGNNFGVTTCESCKTFFRRNAKRDASQIRCLHQNNCNVVKEYRRSCTACRLAKCFAVGMKKELILSEEKLRNRARPTFKKPRYRWCRIPAHIDIDQLLAILPPDLQQQQQQRQQEQRSALINIKQESVTVPDPVLQFSLEEQQHVCSDAFVETGDWKLLSQATSDSYSQAQSNTPLSSSPPSKPSSSQSSSQSSVQCAFECSQIYNQFSMSVTNFLLPYEQSCASKLTSKLYSIEEGFTALESSLKKMIQFIPEMPHFEELEKSLLGKLIKRKVFGSIQLISLLSYHFESDSWIVLLQNSHGLEETVINVHESVQGSFMSLTQRRLHDGRLLYTEQDVEQIYKSLIDYYKQMQQLFGDLHKVAAVMLLGIYLLQDDCALQLSSSERNLIDQLQQRYMHYLRSLISSQFQPISEQVYSKALLLLNTICWLETRYCDATRVMHVQCLPPLMQELISS